VIEDLKNKVVLITGASTGIGAATDSGAKADATALRRRAIS